MTESMQDVQDMSDQVKRARLAEARAQAAEQTSATLRAQLEMVEDELLKTKVERDYFRAFAGDLTTRAGMIEEAVKGMVSKAADIAKLQLVEVQKHEAQVAEQTKQRDDERRQQAVGSVANVAQLPRNAINGEDRQYLR